MGVTVDTVYHAANVDATYSVPVGKKVYGFLAISGLDINIVCGGVSSKFMSNTGQRQYMLPVPMDFKAASVLTFTGSTASTVGVLRDE